MPVEADSIDQDATPQEAWSQLAILADRAGAMDIRALFAADPRRAETYTATLDDLSIDFSKSSVDADAHTALLALAEAAGLRAFRDKLFAGYAVNSTEGRAAMHMALRAPEGEAMLAVLPTGIENAAAIAIAERRRMQDFVTRVHEGDIVGATGQRFTHVLNIGIGGSDLGPRMACEALTLARGAMLTPRFLSNVDGTGMQALARELDPATTLVLVASKTFTTQETATNAAAARDWLAGALGEAAVGVHFVALSTNRLAVASFGIADDRVFGFRDWVGGRYSLWSPVGLSIALAAGWEAFQGMLDGAATMDRHFRDADLAENLPVLLALVGIWHSSVLGYRAQCVLAYDDRLKRFPAYLQQLEMESNGKSVTLSGAAVGHPTCPVIFGEPGTDAQHSFMQLVHQGTQVIPVDFILAANADHDRPQAHRVLAANAFAQAEALLRGRTLEEAAAEMRNAGQPEAAVAAVAPHRVFSGNRPSTTILFEKLDGFALGRLIALYEHKVAVQGAIWGINSFDQWGVELGKVLAGGLLPDLAPGAAPGEHDGSTSALIRRFRDLRRER